MSDFIAKRDPINRSPCPNCGEQMMLARITPASLIPDRETFECLKCNLAESTGS